MSEPIAEHSAQALPTSSRPLPLIYRLSQTSITPQQLPMQQSSLTSTLRKLRPRYQWTHGSKRSGLRYGRRMVISHAYSQLKYVSSRIPRDRYSRAFALQPPPQQILAGATESAPQSLSLPSTGILSLPIPATSTFSPKPVVMPSSTFTASNLLGPSLESSSPIISSSVGSLSHPLAAHDVPGMSPFQPGSSTTVEDLVATLPLPEDGEEPRICDDDWEDIDPDAEGSVCPSEDEHDAAASSMSTPTPAPLPSSLSAAVLVPAAWRSIAHFWLFPRVQRLSS